MPISDVILLQAQFLCRAIVFEPCIAVRASPNGLVQEGDDILLRLRGD